MSSDAGLDASKMDLVIGAMTTHATVARSREVIGAIPALTQAYADLNRLAAQAPTYNFDPGLLVMEIGTLLASLATPSERAHA